MNRYFWPDESATSQLATDLARELAASGYRVVAICSRQLYRDPAGKLLVEELAHGICVRRTWSTRYGRDSILGRLVDYVSFYVSAAVAMRRVRASGTTFIVMTDPPLMSVVAKLACAGSGATIITWHQDVFPEILSRLSGGRALAGINVLRWIRNAVMRHTTNVAIGDVMGDYLATQSAARLKVIPNWAVEEPSSPESEGTRDLRREWGLGDRFVIGYSGNMGRAHSLAVLIDAVKLLPPSSEVALLLVGDGAQRAELLRRVVDGGLQNRVFFKPFQKRTALLDSLAVPDVHVVSLDERLEGLVVPSKFVGVLAAGRPVMFLGSAVGEVGRLVTQFGCGIVSEVRAEAVAATMMAFASDRARCQVMSRAARELWQARFRRQRQVERWRDVIEKQQ